tara:strand:- start:1170 stop:1469 length:300 start_codon:yes stop_codon:yes gene_type:complete
MATVGISASIDVSKIDKTKLIKGEKGTYLNITTFVNLDEKDQYDNNGMVTQSTTKEEREGGVMGTILGNTRVFYTGENSRPASNSSKATVTTLSDEIPF